MSTSNEEAGSTDLPPGYRRDAKQRLVPESTIKAIDLVRDDLVMRYVLRALPLREQLAKFRSDAFSEIDSLIDVAGTEYNAKIGGRKGNVTLYSYDGRYKLIRAISETLAFDERLQVAKSLIDDCVREWSEGTRPEVVVLIQEAFRVDAQGNIRTGNVLGLRRVNIEDARWQQAMRAISDAVQPVESKAYVRLYERDAQGKYQPIALDVAAVS